MRIKIEKGRASGEPANVTDLAGFLAALEKHNRLGATVAIYAREPAGMPSFKGRMPVSSALEAESLEQLILNEFADGDYTLKLLNTKSVVQCEAPLSVGDPQKKRRRSKSEEEAKGQSSAYPGGNMAFFNNIIDKLAPANNSMSMADVMHAQAEMMKVAFDVSSKGNALSEEITRALITNALSPAGDPLDGYLRLHELIKSQAPQVEPDNGLLSALTSILGMLGSGGGGANTAQLMGMLQNQGRPPAPGAPAIAAPAAPVPQGLSDSVEPQATVQAELGQHQVYFKAWIEPLRKMLSAGAGPESLATHIIQMVQYAMQFQADDPHPLVVDMAQAGSDAAMEAGFGKFCAAIPELVNNKGLQQQIKAHLAIAMIAMRAEAQTAEPEAQEIVEETPEASPEVVVLPTAAELDGTEEGVSATQDLSDSQTDSPEIGHEDDQGGVARSGR